MTLRPLAVRKESDLLYTQGPAQATCEAVEVVGCGIGGGTEQSAGNAIS